MSTRISEYILGSVVSINTLFQVRTGTDSTGMPIYTPTDPTLLTLTLESPDGSTQDIVYPATEIQREGPGAYRADIVPDSEGTWNYRWHGTGAAEGADEGSFRVTSALVDQFSFLVLPDDDDAIRSVLGVTDADLENWQIEQATFAGQAEQRIKNRVSNWADQLTDPDRLYALRLATAYATAALIAETYARGGMINNVYPTSRDWPALAELLWQRHEEWVAMAEAWDVVNDVPFAMPMVRASGPTKAGLAPISSVPPFATGWGTRWRGWTKN